MLLRKVEIYNSFFLSKLSNAQPPGMVQVVPSKQMPHSGDLQPVKCLSNARQVPRGMMGPRIDRAMTTSDV